MIRANKTTTWTIFAIVGVVLAGCSSRTEPAPVVYKGGLLSGPSKNQTYVTMTAKPMPAAQRREPGFDAGYKMARSAYEGTANRRNFMTDGRVEGYTPSWALPEKRQDEVAAVQTTYPQPSRSRSADATPVPRQLTPVKTAAKDWQVLPKDVPEPKIGGQAPGRLVRVEPGDSAITIAETYDFPLQTLAIVNDLQPPYELAAGDYLFVPDNPVHYVAPRESLSSVARYYDVSVADLAAYNGLGHRQDLIVNQRLAIPIVAGSHSGLVPNAASEQQQSFEMAPVFDEGPAPIPRPRPWQAGRAASLQPATHAAQSIANLPKRRPARRTVTVASGGRFAWPVDGKIISSFGAKQRGLHNDGINIAVRRGTNVRAAENGVVVYAGNELPGFGKLLLIRHDDGFKTAYAHNAEILVHTGQSVSRGEVVARAGQTGDVDRPQLHFEVRRGTAAVDPLKFLGRRQASVNQTMALPIARPRPG